MTTPTVSVIIPYYEGPTWLPLSLESVRRQRGVSWELIIVDDGSIQQPDTIIDAVRDPRIHLVRMIHAGKGAAINRGVAHARSEFICILDQDDQMVETRCAVQAAALMGNPHAAAVYSDYELVSDGGHASKTVISRQADAEELLHQLAVGRGLISMQTMLIRKTALLDLGGFSEDPTIIGLDDGEFFMRLFCSGSRLRYVPGVVGRWIEHSKNYSKSEKFQDARLSLLRHAVELANEYSLLRKELKYFHFHNYYMRGLFYLEHNRPHLAFHSFQAAVAAHPFRMISYYLLLKSGMMSLYSQCINP